MNPTETLAAKEKQKADQGEVPAVGVRRPRPHRTAGALVYNDAFNNLRPRQFDGSHLDFPGMSRAVTLASTRRMPSGGHDRRQHAAGPRASGPARRSRWPPPA